MRVPFMDLNRVAQVREAINSDPEFRLASRFFSKDILLVVEDANCIVKVRDGFVTDINLNPTFMNSWNFFIKGPAEHWKKFLQPIPPPFFTDLSGLLARQLFEVGGDVEALFAHFWAVNRMLDVVRELQHETTQEAKQQVESRKGQFEPITGRYVYVEIQGVEYRVYFEQNGQGIPLVCQHTAASDGRQWRHLLNDQEVTRKFQVVVPDLPYHGKSLPPESVEWWTQEYKLTKKFFVDFQAEFCRALGLERPVYMGCSMGGRLAVNLALEQPDAFRAVIGLESGVSQAKMAHSFDYHDHPRISNEMRMTAMYGKTAPGNPEKNRREVAWAYGQSAPPVSKGDLYYNFIDHGLTLETAQQINTDRVGVYLLTGEYDWGNSPADTRMMAEQIKGAKVVEMKDLGHFPMIENFDVFKKYVMPILDEIALKG